MSWRTVVISNSAKLDYQMGYMVVRRGDVVKVNVDEIETLMIESTAVSLTAALLNELVKRKVKVIFCDEKHNPSSELLAYYGAHDTSAKVRKQVNWSTDIKRAVWTEVVSDKIRKQAEHLEEKCLHKESEMLFNYIKEMQFGDANNREGHAAKVYFNSLFGKEFSRSDDNSTNAALNYGYTIILSAFNREVVANGYLTQLGIFHDNMFNSFNLASDLMEPFRILIDRIVFRMNPEKFEHDEKMEVLKVLQTEVKIAGKAEYVDNAIKIYCRSVFDALNDNDVSLIKFYNYEL
ncbi:type II CRISPR-associated endonuclease Cas1 [Lachnospira pectinoschiza]|uniref:CRISPR-associated endonuclease Cas1 n=1 Tax=Lachnospira pectinoschiza TaxID=28052 RepID=A0A1G9U3J9_9FIRM|nr:type II CRISPR-associated endonuclease Cas1 [Lachnospira pectinoschiza]SDM54234.1 CRISPR-associated endonuclease Cas1 [Lachnospira pectinoschiza]